MYLPCSLVSESSENGQHPTHGLTPHEYRQLHSSWLHRIKHLLHSIRNGIVLLRFA